VDQLLIDSVHQADQLFVSAAQHEVALLSYATKRHLDADNDGRRQASVQEAAEALFRPREPVIDPMTPAAAAPNDQSTRKPRVLAAVSAPSNQHRPTETPATEANIPVPHSSILTDTQAFITKQRDALVQQRDSISTQQHELQQQLDAVNAMLAKFDVFEGKAAARAPAGRTRRTTTARSGSRRDELLLVIRNGDGLSRGEILEKMGLKGDKAGEMSISNALTALTKSQQVERRDGKYHLAA
jgi:hypothetical protein